ncbi:hypothetical protein [Duganella sp. BuS-21]|uniref:hypothetical protein n=1 Tax=Duganella sp. BuS-21 TaxID=2943848 RepID=UPI0035A732BE
MQVDQEGVSGGALASSRWMLADDGFISPASITPMAEESGLILPINELINICAVQLHQEDFVRHAMQKIIHYKIDPPRLQFFMPKIGVLQPISGILSL